MKITSKLIGLIAFMLLSQLVFSQKTIEEYLSNTKIEKIKKSFVIDAFSKPATHKSYIDGHGKNPYFTSKEQLPDTIALITFHINEQGNVFVHSAANATQVQVIMTLKEEFKKKGVVLLTPLEFLNASEKKRYYYDEYIPKVSKLGTFLNEIENRDVNKTGAAKTYRFFNMAAAFDYKRSVSLGYDLANKLGVDAVLSIGINIVSSSKGMSLKGIIMTMHGPNPNPKMNKKYVAQKSGNGYNNGQLYIGGRFNFKKPIKVFEHKDHKVIDRNLKGLEIVFKCFIEKFYEEFYSSIEKSSK